MENGSRLTAKFYEIDPKLKLELFKLCADFCRKTASQRMNKSKKKLKNFEEAVSKSSFVENAPNCGHTEQFSSKLWVIQNIYGNTLYTSLKKSVYFLSF